MSHRILELGEVIDAAEFVIRVSEESVASGYLNREEAIAQAAVATSFNWFVMRLKGQL